MLKGKLKLIKLALKEWNVTHTHNLLGKIESSQRHVSALDFKWEEEMLSETEIAEMHGITSVIHSLFRITLAFVGNNQGYFGFENEMRIQNIFIRYWLVGAEGKQFRQLWWMV